MENNNMTQDGLERINATLDRIETTVADMKSKLDRIMVEFDKYNDKPSRTITTTYDGEIMYRFKHNDKK